MNSELSAYLADVYSAGFDKSAADGVFGRDAAIGAGIGAGVGGLGGLASYYLQDAKKRRRSSLLNRVLVGGLLGAGSGVAAPLALQGVQPAAQVFKTGDGTINPWIRRGVGGAADALAVGLTHVLSGKDSKAVMKLNGGKMPISRALPVLTQVARRGMLGRPTDPDDTLAAQGGRTALDGLTGLLIANRRVPYSTTRWKGGLAGFGAGALGGLVSDLFSSRMQSRAQGLID